MFWVPIAGQPSANGVPVAPYPIHMMSPGMVATQPSTAGASTALPTGTPPAFPVTATPSTVLNAQRSVAVPNSSTLSTDFSGSGPNTTVNTPSQSSVNVSQTAGAPPSVSYAGSMTGSTSVDPPQSQPQPLYMVGTPGGMPVGYAPMIAPGYMPAGAVPIMPAGGYYPMAAMYPTMTTAATNASSGDFNKSLSAPFFMSAAPLAPPATVPLPSRSICFSAQTSSDFTTVASSASIPPNFSDTFGPPSLSASNFRNDSSSLFYPTVSRSGKMGDAGRGYEAGVYYEGRVKRFNPVRGYGFLSATHKLLRLKDVKAKATAAAAEKKSDAMKEAGELRAEGEEQLKERERKKATGDGKGTSSAVPKSSEKDGATTAETAIDAKANVPLINVISAAGNGVDPEINLDDIVVIKGEEYVRKPVVMGDIFVHYHCLQRTPEELESERSGALVNLPAGARVQFKAEVFVPAKLMEEAHDSKQAAAMLNSIGIPVDDDPNLLAGAIATKKGWGYQAMDVVQLPSQSPTVASRRGHRGKPRGVGNASIASNCSANSTRRSNTPSHSRSEAEESSDALAPCSSQNLRIHVKVESTRPPPPSFESATAGMKYVVPTAGSMMLYPAYPSVMPRQV